MEGEEQSNNIEQALISEEGSRSLGDEIIEEAKKQVWLAGPLIAVSILQYCLQVISIMFVGHLGELPLSSASMATSFASVSGFSILLDMGSSLETLCGQCYGAKQYHMLGIHTQRAIIVLIASSIPLMFVWSYTTNILIFFGQDYDISKGAGEFNCWMIPSLFAYGILQCLNRFLQTQNLVLPMMLSSAVTVVLHIIVCWTFVFKLQMGIKGVALANSVSYWVNVIGLALYVKLSPSCNHTWIGFSIEAMHHLSSLLKLAIPSTFMICLEYWSFEMVALLSGLLPNPKLETSVLSISLNTCWIVYMISVGLGGAVRSRESKGRPFSYYCHVCIAVSQGLLVCITTIVIRHVWGRLYSNEYEVVAYVAKMMPLLAISNFLDGFQCVLSGAARGYSWQNACALINLGAYYLVALPCAVIFGFVLHFGGMGLWLGIICGLLLQVLALITLNLRTNWNDEARRADNRIQSCIIDRGQKIHL